MEMSGPLSVESAVRRPAFLGGSESLEPFLYNSRVLSMVVRVHLHVRRTDVHLIARALQHVRVLCVNNRMAMTTVLRGKKIPVDNSYFSGQAKNLIK
jgi:hypothetical protein